jgi:heme-degrading monooxygenase HmoA
MIALNVYLTPKAGKAAELESAIRDVWIKAMTEQPGFLRAATLKPFAADELVKLEAMQPQHTYEVVSYWTTEEERAAWAARDIHQEVWPQVADAAEDISYTLQTVEQNWNL